MPGAMPQRVAVRSSDDGAHWHALDVPRVRSGNDDALMVSEGEARHLRLDLEGARSVALAEIEIEDLAWGASANAFFGNLAKAAPRGDYPRGFVEQNYWTIVGVDGGPTPALISEDGALQPGKTGFSVEPLLRVDGRLLTWADVAPAQSLRDGYLPMPGVTWKSGDIELAIGAFADGDRARSQLVATYGLRNDADQPRRVELALAIRPFQVNPPMQFLNSAGGVAPIHDLARDGRRIVVDGEARVVALSDPDAFVAGDLRQGTIVEQLQNPSSLPAHAGEGAETARAPQHASAESVHDAAGHATAALVYRVELPAHGSHRISVLMPLTGPAQMPPAGQSIDAWVEARASAVAEAWRARLDRVRIGLPAQAQRLADTLRTAHAHMLLSRDGPALRPGTRSYARSWIRDGAMIADALLQLGDIDAVRDYVDWYAPHQFGNGKVPCCVDHRGSDPVPENDSHGELIHAIAQLYRYGGDRAELEKNWPHVEAAIAYMEQLRASQTGAEDPAFKGLLPASISHEGYSAKPMHSYWDDAWGLTGYKDAVDVARALGKTDAAQRIAAARDVFEHDLLASIAGATKAHAIDYLPGSAELGDFDPTSTTIALNPAGLQARLPQDLLHATFARYWREFAARAAGTRAWKDYTPYEWRTVGSFVRLGERDHAQAAGDFFFASGARPIGWNQWAEVVRHDPRTPGFVGDMPHAWVASDFVRSTLDRFAYERASDHALVLAAGVAPDWLDGAGIAIEHLRTPYGELGYTLARVGGRVELRVAAGAVPPGGFVFAWPTARSAKASVNGHAAKWNNAEVHFEQAPATVTLEQ
jgi:hypothetical protein